MIKREPLLSICIPTYNREKYLKRLLDSIVCQKEFLDTNDVEIVVDDGPSSDNTESIVKEYIKKFWNKIKYYKNPVRIWMCPAFLESLALWTGEYLRLIWRDDFMTSNALLNTLKCINEYNPKIIFSRRKEVHFWDKISEENKKCEISCFNWMTDFSKYLWDKTKWTFHDKEVFFTFISTFCINKLYYREAYNYLINNVWYREESLKKHYFNFSLIALSHIKNNYTISIINNPISVYCENSNCSWTVNTKISKDLSYLINFIKKEYKITLQCKIFFFRLDIIRKINCSNIRPYIKNFLIKIWLYKSILKLYEKLK